MEVFIQHRGLRCKRIRTFNFCKKCKQYYPLLPKNTVKAKTSKLPVIQIIQKALYQKLSVKCSNWQKRQTLSANAGSLDARRKSTFYGKSNYSNFVGCVIQLFIIETFQTALTFLLPIPCPITKFSTVCETKDRSTHLKFQTWSIHIL